jgi:hypothetical protein
MLCIIRPSTQAQIEIHFSFQGMPPYNTMPYSYVLFLNSLFDKIRKIWDPGIISYPGSELVIPGPGNLHFSQIFVVIVRIVSKIDKITHF